MTARTTPDDSEAVAWAYKKLCAFGCENGKPDTVEMMDRLKLMLLGQTVAQSETTRLDVLREVEQRIHDCYNMQRASAWPHCEGVARAKQIVRTMIEEAQRG